MLQGFGQISLRKKRRQICTALQTVSEGLVFFFPNFKLIPWWKKKLEIQTPSKKIRSIRWKFYSYLRIGGNSSCAVGVRVGTKVKKYRNHALQVSKLSESFWNLHQSIRNKISDVPSAAEHFLTPSELWDTRFSFFQSETTCRNSCLRKDKGRAKEGKYFQQTKNRKSSISELRTS